MAVILSLVIGVIGTVLSIGSGLFWLIQQSSTKEVKRYAAEREFGHIKESQLQLSINLANYFQDTENKLDDIKSSIQEVKYQLNQSGRGSNGHL
jgi:hypothetical protein